MPVNVKQAVRWAFDAFLLDRRDARLWRHQEILPLSPKPFALLCHLVAHAGQLVTKEAFLEAVWFDTMGKRGGAPGGHPAAAPGVR